MIKLPLSATVVSCNEEVRLADCLKSLTFCDEIIVCDLGSTDRTLAIAAELATSVLSAEHVPYAEMVIPSLVEQARHDWIFRLDPDEVVDPHLVPWIRQALIESPDLVCGYYLPWEFYFRGRKLIGTFWGGRKYKVFVTNRTRVEYRPYAHYPVTARPGMRWETIDGPAEAIIHHFWVDTYGQLFEKHLRYLENEGEARYKTGQRFRTSAFLLNSLGLLKHNLRPSAWWKDGLRGLFLCCFFIWYETSARLSLLAYQADQTKLSRRR
jgi:glycosyltransferase involved in cell wall biosynthesis